MPIYKQTTEITNIDDLLSSVERDIEEVYFGDKNVFTVWGEYEGTLPATLNANGDDMRQYQVYGATGGVGDRTENLYDKNNDSMNFIGYINNDTLKVIESSVGSFSIIVPVEPNTTYTIVKPATSRFRVGLFTSYPNVGNVATAIYGNRDGDGIDYGTSLTFTTSNNTNYVLTFIRNYDDTSTTNELMKNFTVVCKGSTAPASYEPYGYKLDMGVKSANLCPPIVITGVSYYTALTSGVFFDMLKSLTPNEFYRISWQYESSGAGGAANQIRLINNSSSTLKQMDNNSIFSLTAAEISNFTVIAAYFGANNTNGKMSNFMLSAGSTALPYQPYSNTTTPIYIGDEPLDEDEYVDYAEQKVYRRTENLYDNSNRKVFLGYYNSSNNTIKSLERNAFVYVPIVVGKKYIIKNFERYNPSIDIRWCTVSQVKENQQCIRSGSFPQNTKLEIVAESSENFLMIFLCGDSDYSQYGGISASLNANGANGEISTNIPTDPPVPLPALPTCEGNTVIDYDGTPAPSSVYVKYKKGW